MVIVQHCVCKVHSMVYGRVQHNSQVLHKWIKVWLIRTHTLHNNYDNRVTVAMKIVIKIIAMYSQLLMILFTCPSI